MQSTLQIVYLETKLFLCELQLIGVISNFKDSICCMKSVGYKLFKTDRKGQDQYYSTNILKKLI